MQAGIMIHSLGVSQLSMHLIYELNQVPTYNEYVDIIVFYREYGKILKTPKFALMQEENAWGLNGPVMSTDLQTTSRLLLCPKPKRKIFYVWNLEWMFHQYDAEAIARIYCHRDIILVARSPEHAKIISNCWKDPVAILEDFNHEQLIRIFKE